MSFLRVAAGRLSKLIQKNGQFLGTNNVSLKTMTVRPLHHLEIHPLSAEDLDEKWQCYYNDTDIDGWDLRQRMNDMAGMDMVPDPVTIIAALQACRRVNDYALAIRYMESIREKCGPFLCNFYPYILQEIAPTLCELGIDTLEELGYDKPELYLQSVMDM